MKFIFVFCLSLLQALSIVSETFQSRIVNVTQLYRDRLLSTKSWNISTFCPPWQVFNPTSGTCVCDDDQNSDRLFPFFGAYQFCLPRRELCEPCVHSLQCSHIKSALCVRDLEVQSNYTAILKLYGASFNNATLLQKPELYLPGGVCQSAHGTTLCPQKNGDDFYKKLVAPNLIRKGAYNDSRDNDSKPCTNCGSKGAFCNRFTGTCDCGLGYVMFHNIRCVPMPNLMHFTFECHSNLDCFLLDRRMICSNKTNQCELSSVEQPIDILFQELFADHRSCQLCFGQATLRKASNSKQLPCCYNSFRRTFKLNLPDGSYQFQQNQNFFQQNNFAPKYEERPRFEFRSCLLFLSIILVMGMVVLLGYGSDEHAVGWGRFRELERRSGSSSTSAQNHRRTRAKRLRDQLMSCQTNREAVESQVTNLSDRSSLPVPIEVERSDNQRSPRRPRFLYQNRQWVCLDLPIDQLEDLSNANGRQTPPPAYIQACETFTTQQRQQEAATPDMTPFGTAPPSYEDLTIIGEQVSGETNDCDNQNDSTVIVDGAVNNNQASNQCFK